ncbi:MAG: ArsR/SmtB family transcription factor [Gemmatimonadaceae bacterium]
MTARLEVFDRMSVLADAIRGRTLLALERHELTVSELCSVLQLPQSTMSRHLGTLASDEWVSARADGTSRWYSMAPERLDPPARKLWNVVREQISTTAQAAHDEQRLAAVIAERRAASKQFFSTAAGRWDRLRSELFGERPELTALLGLIGDDLIVGDLGCGTGQLAETLAPHAQRVIAIDDSSAMLAAARKRLDGVKNVRIRKGDLQSLPLENGELDVAILFLVLHYVPEPLRALAEAQRATRDGGRILIVDMLPHDREAYRQQMGHVWQGFSESQMRSWLEQTGFNHIRYRPLPPDQSAKGPVLFAATARK